MALAAVASAIAFGLGPFAHTSATPTSGPDVVVDVDPVSVAELAHSPFTAALAGEIEIDIRFALPSAVGYAGQGFAELNATTNPYVDLLYQSSPNASGVASGALSPQFYAIDSAWLATMSPMTTELSLQLTASLNVVSNGTDSVYTFVNNMPYNPRALPATFSAIVTFPPQPTFEVPASGSSGADHGVPASLGGGGGGCTPSYEWGLLSATEIPDGDLPIAIVNDAGAPTGASVAYAIDYSDTAMQLSFTSGTEYTSSGAVSGLQMSESPSWSGNDVSFAGGLYTNDAISGENAITAIVLTQVELYVQNYQYEYVGSSCKITETYPDFESSVEVLGYGGGSNFIFADVVLPSYYGSFIEDEEDWGELTSESLPWGSSGFQLYSVMSSATGYDSAASAEAQVQSALSTLSDALGTALCICDVLDLIPDAGDVANTAEAIEILSTIAGDEAAFATLINGISFSTTEATSVEQFAVDAGTGGIDVNQVAYLYADTKDTTLTLSSGTYTPLIPLPYVVAE